MTAPASFAEIMARGGRRLGQAKRRPNTVVERRRCVGSSLSLDPTYDSPSRPAPFGLQPGRAAGLGEVAHAQDVALALGHRDDAAGVEQVEDMARLDALVVGRERQLVALVVGAGRRPAGL